MTTIAPSTLSYRQGVGMCVFNPQGFVLCAERRDTRGAWQMPQGGVQKGEDLTVTVLRELKEEIGTDHVEILAHIPEKLSYEFPDYLQYRHGVFRGKYRGQEQTWFALLYLGADSDIKLDNEHEQELPEFIHWKWVPLQDTPDLIVPFKRNVYERLVKEFTPIAEALQKGQTLPQWTLPKN